MCTRQRHPRASDERLLVEPVGGSVPAAYSLSKASPQQGRAPRPRARRRQRHSASNERLPSSSSVAVSRCLLFVRGVPVTGTSSSSPRSSASSSLQQGRAPHPRGRRRRRPRCELINGGVPALGMGSSSRSVSEACRSPSRVSRWMSRSSPAKRHPPPLADGRMLVTLVGGGLTLLLSGGGFLLSLLSGAMLLGLHARHCSPILWPFERERGIEWWGRARERIG